MDFKIVRNAVPYLFNLTAADNTPLLTAVAFEQIQEFLGVEPENYSKVDDNRYLMIV